MSRVVKCEFPSSKAHLTTNSQLLSAISSCRNSLRASTKALHPLASPSSAISLPPILPGLPESLAQLLSRLHHDITSLALSFKPPITEAAATAQLDKVHEGYGRIAACVVAASGGTKCDSFLVEEWREGVESIGTELERLLDVLEKAATTSGSSSTSKSDSENPYLLYTGVVWEAIGRLSSDLSTSEIQSVGKKWRSQGEVLKDAWTEYKEFLEEQDEDDEDESDEAGFDDDDEFGELQDMLSGGKKMSEEERARAEAVSLPSKLPTPLSLTNVGRQKTCWVCIKSFWQHYRDIYPCWRSSQTSHIVRY